jgi:hypothetical protein
VTQYVEASDLQKIIEGLNERIRVLETRESRPGGLPLFLGAGQFEVVSGATFVYDGSDVVGWSFPDGVTSSIAAVWQTPPGYIVTKSVKYTLVWTNGAADGAGDVRWALRTDADGFPLNGASITAGSTSVTATAPAYRTSKGTDPGRVDGFAVVGTFSNIAVLRVGGDAADTLGNACTLMGVLISYV